MTSSPDESAFSGQFERWLAEARQGSAEALDRLVQACRPYLDRLANRVMPAHLRSKAGSSDLVGDTVVKAVVGFPNFRGSSEGELRRWLRTILLHTKADLVARYQNAANDVHREESIDREGAAGQEPAAGESSPSSQVGAAEESLRLQQAMEQLPEEYRIVIRLHHIEDLSFEEIGHRLDCTGRTARRRWTRALLALGKLMRPPHEHP